MQCPLYAEFERQFVCGDYLSTNQRRCRILQRIDDVAGISRWNIDIPRHRLNLLAEIKPAYDAFAAYMEDRHPHVKTVGRHGNCYATLEWHGLHQYLVVNGVTTEAVDRYIKADAFDRELFHAAKMTGEFIYFSKHPKKIDEALYKASVAPRYDRRLMESATDLPPPDVNPEHMLVDFSADPLVNLIKSQQFYGHYAADPVQIKLRALERIDQIAGALGAPIDEAEDRLALAGKLQPLYGAFHQYLVEELPEVYHEGRNGVVLASLEWHALNLFLLENGFTGDSVARFIEADRGDRDTFREKRLSAQYVYYSKYPTTLDPSLYPLSSKRYAV